MPKVVSKREPAPVPEHFLPMPDSVENVAVGLTGLPRAREITLNSIRPMKEASKSGFVRDEYAVVLTPLKTPVDVGGRLLLDFNVRPLFLAMDVKRGGELNWFIDAKGGQTSYDIERRTEYADRMQSSYSPDVVAVFNLNTNECRVEGLEDLLPHKGMLGFGRRQYTAKLGTVKDAVEARLRSELPLDDLLEAYSAFVCKTHDPREVRTLGERLRRVFRPADYEGSIQGITGVVEAFRRGGDMWVAVTPTGGAKDPFVATVVNEEGGGFVDEGKRRVDYKNGVVLRIGQGIREDDVRYLRGRLDVPKDVFQITRDGDYQGIEKRAYEIARKLLDPMFGVHWKITERE
jgi:hypothetical protein